MAEHVICGPAARAAILADLAARPRIEACGLLLGTIADGAWRVAAALALRNTDDSAASFEFDPEELLRADLEHGERIIGAYHSHLGGPAYPSRKDLRNMQAHTDSPWIWLIVAAPPRPRQTGLVGTGQADTVAEGKGAAVAEREGASSGAPASMPATPATPAAEDAGAEASTGEAGAAESEVSTHAPAPTPASAAGTAATRTTSNAATMADWSSVKVGAFRVDGAGTLLIYPVVAGAAGAAGTEAAEP